MSWEQWYSYPSVANIDHGCAAFRSKPLVLANDYGHFPALDRECRDLLHRSAYFISDTWFQTENADEAGKILLRRIKISENAMYAVSDLVRMGRQENICFFSQSPKQPQVGQECDNSQYKWERQDSRYIM